MEIGKLEPHTFEKLDHVLVVLSGKEVPTSHSCVLYIGIFQIRFLYSLIEGACASGNKANFSFELAWLK